MTGLLELKDRFIRFYSKYETWLFPVIKFFVALTLFAMINAHIGFMEAVSSWPAAFVFALVCAVLPVNAMIWLAAAVVLADMYALSLEVAVTTLVLFAALFFLYFRFAPEMGLWQFLRRLHSDSVFLTLCRWQEDFCAGFPLCLQWSAVQWFIIIWMEYIRMQGR